MTTKLPLRFLITILIAMAVLSLARADIHVSATQNSGHTVEKIAPAPWKENYTGPDAPANSMWFTGYPYSETMLHISIDTHVPKGTYYVGQVWDVSWVDWEDVYVTIN